MKRDYHRWNSPSLGRDMEMLVFGHAGARVLVFPTSKGRFFEWEDRGMIGALSGPIDAGDMQVFCVDSVDAESWYCYWAHPSGRAYRHVQYDTYLVQEVLPLMDRMNGSGYTISLGASFGGYHAMNFGLRHPDRVQRIIALSGIYDIRRFVFGHYDDNIYFNNPADYIPGETDENRLALLRRQDIIMATGREDTLMPSARDLSAKLWGKGIGNALREWDGWAHDWPFWEKMVLLYISGHD
jgi:esterase/lipase superfamily enzyme